MLENISAEPGAPERLLVKVVQNMTADVTQLRKKNCQVLVATFVGLELKMACKRRRGSSRQVFSQMRSGKFLGGCVLRNYLHLELVGWLVGGWWLVVGGWWLLVGGCWLVVGGWLLLSVGVFGVGDR